MSSRSATWILSRSRFAWIESETVLASRFRTAQRGGMLIPGH